MWPLTYMPEYPDTGWQLAALFAASVIFVFAVFAMLLRRLTRTRREMLGLACPVDRRRALVVVQRSADGPWYDRVVHCSKWHDGQVDCGQRCVDKAA